MDWDDPVARYNLIESVGIDGYNKALHQHFKDSEVACVISNRRAIRTVGSKFGRLFFIADKGFKQLFQAIDYGATLPAAEDAR